MLSQITHYSILKILSRNRPQAIAWINGTADYPKLNGTVRFYEVPGGGLLVEAELFQLPDSESGSSQAFFGFHIHENGDCSGDLSGTGNHYNPDNSAHPFHAGDLPPLMAGNGYAWSAFYDARITLAEILNRSVVIHRMPDDFRSQPAGDAGKKIACGLIRKGRG